MHPEPPAPVIEVLQLDKSLLVLDKEEEEFLMLTTGITTSDELKEHIYAVQEEAYKVEINDSGKPQYADVLASQVHPFPCIRQFDFTKMNISRFPSYQEVLKLAKARPDAIFLDAGCCFGNDTRKIVHDGFPVQNVVATDLYPEFWNLGHKLFKSSPESFPAKFIPGDIFDPNTLALPNDENPTLDLTDLQSLTSLNPLRGHVSFINASRFFHLFSEEKQFQIARLFAGLLDPRPGSTIFGYHGSLLEKGLHPLVLAGFQMFAHSPESWIDLWENQVFEKGTVKVEASLSSESLNGYGFGLSGEFYFMTWSVRRVR